MAAVPVAAVPVAAVPVGAAKGCCTCATCGIAARSVAAVPTTWRTRAEPGSTPSSRYCTDEPNRLVAAIRSAPVRDSPCTCGASSAFNRLNSPSLPSRPSEAANPTTTITTQASRNQRARRAISAPKTCSTGASVAGVTDLFSTDPDERPDESQDGAGPSVPPLAVRMRPRTVGELVGQEHLLRPGSPLRRLADGSGGPARPASVIL